MQGGVPPTTMKRSMSSSFREFWVVLARLRESHSGLMLDEVKDLIDR